MPALGCQSVSADTSLSLLSLARRRAVPAASLLLAALLSGCAPMTPSAEGAISTQGEAASDTRVGMRFGSELLAKIAPPPARGLGDPAKALKQSLYELELPEVDQQGVASWYGPGFHGRKTANGERFNQYELTAAHPTYAFGTQLCVRSKATGQAVVVRVNDRGPFVKNRVIDLSKAAAEEIGMLDRGVKSVEIYKLDEGQDDCPDALLQAKG
ncbi:MAG: septal ring lytic transglycosylase RlpA family protein [Comamonas sp.]|jgi:rare lipoprotein A